jgi:glutathione S-transferase
MILHHYPMSPFSEKIRLMFAYAGLPWQSLVSPEMPPRPNVDPLSGGYRRIPIAQDGADIFCDTRLISEELSVRAGIPALSPYHGDAATRDFVAHLESDIFWACVLSIPVGVTLKQLLRNIGLWQTLRFLKDRASVGKAARMDAPSPKEAAQTFQRHLEDLEQRLSADFLCGSTAANADFCAYHTLWFKRVVGELPMPPGLPRVTNWYERMQAIGHGEYKEISQAEAFAAARDNTPRTIPAEYTLDENIGKPVHISPSDYALDAVAGTLVACSDTRYIVSRDSEQFGTVHVHFPRTGFELKPSTAA